MEVLVEVILPMLSVVVVWKLVNGNWRKRIGE
jgi:hypothetical protein